MPARLYLVHGSHPCAAVRRALDLKGISYKVVEFPPPMHVPLQRLRFGGRTVPGLVLEDGERLQGSTAIMRRLDELVPDPALFAGAAVAEAEEWGERVLQPIARRLLWRGFAFDAGAMVGYQAGGRLPPLPRPVVLAMAPGIIRVERRMNQATDDAVRADLAALAGYLDHVDGLIADGVLGGEPPNAADLQIFSTLRLVMTLGDLRDTFGDRPAARHALRLFPDQSGELPAGTFPPSWLPAAAASARQTVG
jgi:glutathione S-transferase